METREKHMRVSLWHPVPSCAHYFKRLLRRLPAYQLRWPLGSSWQQPCRNPKNGENNVLTWRHLRHIGIQKHWNGGHIGAPNQIYGSWIFFFCKNFLLLQLIFIATGHVSENALSFIISHGDFLSLRFENEK